MRYVRLLPGLFLLFTLFGSGQTQPPPLQLQLKIPEIMEQAGIPGLSIAVVHEGKLDWVGNFGVRSREKPTRVDEETVFEAASLIEGLAMCHRLKSPKDLASLAAYSSVTRKSSS